MGIQDPYRSADSLPDELNRGEQIGVVRHHDGQVEAPLVGVRDHLRREVDIGALFLGSEHFDGSAAMCRGNSQWHTHDLGHVVPIVDGHLRQRPKRPEVELLAVRLAWVPRATPYPRGEVLDLYEHVVGGQQVPTQPGKVQPAEWSVPQAAVVQVEGIDIDNGPHTHPWKKQKPPRVGGLAPCVRSSRGGGARKMDPACGRVNDEKTRSAGAPHIGVIPKPASRRAGDRLDLGVIPSHRR